MLIFYFYLTILYLLNSTTYIQYHAGKVQLLTNIAVTQYNVCQILPGMESSSGHVQVKFTNRDTKSTNTKISKTKNSEKKANTNLY